MKFLNIILLVMTATLSSCIVYETSTQTKKPQLPKVREGDLFTLDRLYGDGSLTYDQALSAGKLVFARNGQGQLILAEPGGSHMIPKELYVPELRGYSLQQARISGHLMLSWEGEQVKVHYFNF